MNLATAQNKSEFLQNHKAEIKQEATAQELLQQTHKFKNRYIIHDDFNNKTVLFLDEEPTVLQTMVKQFKNSFLSQTKEEPKVLGKIPKGVSLESLMRKTTKVKYYKEFDIYKFLQFLTYRNYTYYAINENAYNQYLTSNNNQVKRGRF